MIPEDKIIDYLEGNLEATQVEKIEAEIADDPSMRSTLEEYRALLQEFDNQPDYQPSENLSRRFYAHLDQAQVNKQPLAKSRQLPYKRLLQVAAAMLIFVLGISLGKYWNQEQSQKISQIEEELKSTQSMILKMLKTKSASQRIKAVNFSYDMKTTDQKIIDALIQTMNFDKNLNVRLHAAEALTRFGSEEKVRDAFIMALASQDNPEMQIKAISILVQLREERAVGELLKLLDQDQLIEPVKESVQEGLNILM